MYTNNLEYIHHLEQVMKKIRDLDNSHDNSHGYEELK